MNLAGYPLGAAIAGALLLIAGLATLAYDNLRRKRGNNPYPFPDAATNTLEDTAVQPARPVVPFPALPARSWPGGALRSRFKRKAHLSPPAGARPGFFTRLILATPRRSLVTLVVCSVTLISLSLAVLAAGSGSTVAQPGTTVIAIAPFGVGDSARDAQVRLADYIAQSIAAAGPGPAQVLTVTTSPVSSVDAEVARSRPGADIFLWGELGPDNSLSATLYLSPGFSAGQKPWQALSDPDLVALALPHEAELVFPAGAGTDPLVPLITALAEFRAGSYASAADAAWGAQETLDQEGATGQVARLLEGEARLASGDYNGAVEALSKLEQSANLPDEGLNTRALAEFYSNDYSAAMADCGRVISDRNATNQVLSIAYLIRARTRAAQSDLSGALSDLDEGARLDPGNLRMRLERAEVLYRGALPTEAAAELVTVMKSVPSAPEPFKLMGLVRMMQGQPQDALTNLDTAYSLYQGFISELRAEEGQASATGDGVRSQEATNGIIKLNLQLAEVALYQGMAWADLARHEPKESFLGSLWRGIRGEPATWEKALSKLQEAQRLDARRPDIPLQIGSLYAQQGDYSGAATALGQARSLDPSAPEPYMALANVQVAQGRTADAITTLEGYLSYSPGYYPAYEQVYSLYSGMNDTASAQATLERAVAVAPQTPSDHLWRGKFLKTLGRVNEAEAELRIAGQDSQLWEAHLELGQLLLSSDRGPEALDEFQSVLAVQPNNDTALLEAGRLLVLAGRQDEAQRLFERLTAVSPSNVDGHLALLQLLLTRGDAERAISEGKAAVAIDDSRSDSHYYLGLAYETARDWHQASGEYETATQRDPNNFQAFLSLSKSLFSEDRYKEAVTAADKAQSLRADDPEPYRWKTEAQLALGALDDAEGTASLLLKLAPGDAPALALAARLYSAAGDASAALDYAHQSIDASPNNPVGQEALGEVELASQRPEEALQAFGAVVQMGDSRTKALALTGEARAYSMLGDNQKAMQLLGAASEQDSSAPEPYLYLGTIYASANRWEEAMQAYHRAVELRPNWPLALYYLGQSYLQKKDLQKAQAALAKAVSYSPNMVQAWFGLGISERDRGKSDEAIQALSRATQLNGHYAEAWLYLGLTYEEAGQRSKAADAFSQAAANATNPDVRGQAEQGLARVR